MKTFPLILSGFTLLVFACSSPEKETTATVTAEPTEAAPVSGQKDVADDVSQPNVVKIAVNSPDHSTLVKAVTAADLVNALSNNGPFTVFAPTNQAFDALPAGTLDDLMKPEKKSTLSDILEYHVYVGVLQTENLSDGQTLNMVNGDNANITAKDGKYQINGANIVASVPASNGIVHVIDKVILPPSE